MKYLQYPITKSMRYRRCQVPKVCAPTDCGPKDCARAAASSSSSSSSPPSSLKPIRSVHFPNEVLFHDYVRTGELECIGSFVKGRRVSLDTIYHSGMAAIHEAVLSGNLACVKLLVELGADIHQRDEEDWTPLHMACSDSFPEIARYLLSQGADVNAQNEDGDKPADLIDPDCKELLELFGVGSGD